MEFLAGFILTLLKMAVQAAAYATLAHGLAQLADRQGFDHALIRASRAGKRFWRLSWVAACAALGLFANTYWGDHGLGDSARIPLGHGEAIEEINGTEAYFEAKVPVERPIDQPVVEAFAVADDVLCARAADATYFTYDLATKQHQLFADSLAYADYARPIGLPAAREFTSFNRHYGRYWGGWRFWLLA